jgi:hypothetical protein
MCFEGHIETTFSCPMTRVLLLDIDGVLVSPGGYRAALHATLNYFVNLMGLPHFEFPEEKLARFEQRGITSEWDMVPLLLGVLWNDILSHQTGVNLPADVPSAAVEIGHHLNGYQPSDLIIPEFELVVGQYPADTALQNGFFPSIPMPLRNNLLHRSRDVRFSQTMRIFQHFTLGSEAFTQTYDLPAEVETESLLRKYDRSNIDDTIREKLCQPGIRLTAFTARPSAPPREVEAPPLGYAPEAEIALDLVGLSDVPLISFGKLQYLGEQRGYDPEVLLKPSPVQALAGIAAALTGNEWASLQAACDWYETGQLKGALTELPQPLDVTIVEDTLGGVRSVHTAGEILQRAGLDVTVRAYGLTSGSVAKSAAFEQTGLLFFSDWESLIKRLGL